MLLDIYGNDVTHSIKTKHLNTAYYNNIREVKVITEKLYEVPGGFFELQKRVRYHRRGSAPSKQGLHN